MINMFVIQTLIYYLMNCFIFINCMMEVKLLSGIFAVKNNKTTGQLAHEENNVRYLKKQGAKLHSVKVDIESFYPNVYTHYFSKIKDAEPYKDNICCDTLILTFWIITI